jgi:hypothetical protein
MSTLDRRTDPAQQQAAQAPPIPTYMDARRILAASYLFGEGLEIGPLHLPLAIPPQVTVRYVDRMEVDDLRREYPELAQWDLTPVDIVDDGELLTTVPAESQDFIVANHFLEHCENPISTIETHLGKLRPGGVLFYAVPDKRFTFDFRRPATPLEHMVADYENGPEGSRREHYDEWTRFVVDEESPSVGTAEQATDEDWAARKARELEEAKYSIHMHVWTQAEFLQLILDCRRRFAGAFDIEVAARQGIEFMVVLRKRGPLPPPVPPSPDAGGETPLAVRLRRRAKRALTRLRKRREGARP